MPLFEFVCQACQLEFEDLVLGSSETVCPGCASKDIQKKMSAFAFKSGSKFRSAASGDGCTSCSSTSCRSCSGH